MKAVKEVKEINVKAKAAGQNFPSPNYEDAGLNETNGSYIDNLETMGWTCDYVVRVQNNSSEAIVVKNVTNLGIYEMVNGKGVLNTLKQNGDISPNKPVTINGNSEMTITIPVIRAMVVQKANGFSPNLSIQYIPKEGMKYTAWGGFTND